MFTINLTQFNEIEKRIEQTYLDSIWELVSERLEGVVKKVGIRRGLRDYNKYLKALEEKEEINQKSKINRIWIKDITTICLKFKISTLANRIILV